MKHYLTDDTAKNIFSPQTTFTLFTLNMKKNAPKNNMEIR